MFLCVDWLNPVDTTCAYIEARLFIKANNYYKMMTFFIFVVFLPFHCSPYRPPLPFRS